MDQANNLNYAWEIIKIFLYLGVVIVLIYLINHFLRNFRRYFKQSGSDIKVITRGFLTQNSQVCIIEVNEKYYLLGITEEKITVLDTFDEINLKNKETLSPIHNPSFGEILKRTFRKKDDDNE